MTADWLTVFTNLKGSKNANICLFILIRIALTIIIFLIHVIMLTFLVLAPSSYLSQLDWADGTIIMV